MTIDALYTRHAKPMQVQCLESVTDGGPALNQPRPNVINLLSYVLV